jgi:hypothetical protein
MKAYQTEAESLKPKYYIDQTEITRETQTGGMPGVIREVYRILSSWLRNLWWTRPQWGDLSNRI